MNNLIYKIQYVFAGLLSACALPLQAQHAANANSVIVDAQTNIVCKSMTQSVEKQSRTITVLNRKGLDAAQFVCGCDMFRSLQKFSGEILNSSGQTVRKIKKSDLQKTEYSSNLATDDYVYYYNCNFSSFPFTVKYEWEVKCNNGLIGYPSFVPQTDFLQGVEKASFRIELPAGQTCRYHALNNDDNKIQIKESAGDAGQRIIEARASQLAPVSEEPFGPAFSELFPRVYFAPSAFIYDKSEGNLDTWQTYGAWQYKLLEGRGTIPEELRSKLHELTANCRNDREKVKAIYDYLAETTRYVSIQLGIGGLQPIPAANVCRTGFGDCKGLSNYMAAMLKEVGIPSTYTVISTVNRRLLPEFSSANQMNHVILQVPLPQDTLCLECTNPQLPLGYVHQSIAGHDALLVRPEGGSIYTLPIYADSLNTQHITADIKLSPDAEARIEASETSRLFQYENRTNLSYLKPNKQKDRIREGIKLLQADILQLRIDEHKEADPSVTVQYTISSNQYGEKTGNRLFIPTNIFRKEFYVPHITERKTPIHINYGYADTDSIRIHLPEGYVIEGRPGNTELKTRFGNFKSTIRVEGKEVLVVHGLSIARGVYPPEAYADFIDFRKKVSAQYSARIVLKKE